MTAPAATAEVATTRWLTVGEVAELVNKRPRTVRHWCKKRTVLKSARQIGRGWEIPEFEVLALLNPESVAA